MGKAKRSAINWSACKAAIKSWPAPELTELVHELYKLSPENQRFLHARLVPEASQQTIDQIKNALRRVLSPSSVYNDRFSHAETKKIVDQFARAADDPASVADVLIADLGMAFQTFQTVGDFEPIVDHLYATLYRLDKVLATLPREQLIRLIGPIDQLAEAWGDKFGYGISDEMHECAENWRHRVTQQNRSA